MEVTFQTLSNEKTNVGYHTLKHHGLEKIWPIGKTNYGSQIPLSCKVGHSKDIQFGSLKKVVLRQQKFWESTKALKENVSCFCITLVPSKRILLSPSLFLVVGVSLRAWSSPASTNIVPCKKLRTFMVSSYEWKRCWHEDECNLINASSCGLIELCYRILASLTICNIDKWLPAHNCFEASPSRQISGPPSGLSRAWSQAAHELEAPSLCVWLHLEVMHTFNGLLEGPDAALSTWGRNHCLLGGRGDHSVQQQRYQQTLIIDTGIKPIPGQRPFNH